MSKKDEAKRARAIELSERVVVLLQFASTLIPDLDLLEALSSGADERAEHVLSMAPILGALGENYEIAHFKKSFEAKRAHALYNLIKTLIDTENEREAFQKKQAGKEVGRAQIARALGL